MDCTPDNVYLQSGKDQQLSYKMSSIDSGYSESFLSPTAASVGKCTPCRPISRFSDECDEMPKENISSQRHQRSTTSVTPKTETAGTSVTPKRERTKVSGRFSGKDFRREQPLSVGWCETPKVYKKDASSLRRRLHVGESVTDVKTGNTRTSSKRNESSVSIRSELRFSGSFDSPDTAAFGALASNSLKVELDQPLSGRKIHTERPVSVTDAESVISGHRTTGLPETPISRNFLSALAEENTQTPVNQSLPRQSKSLSALSTPSRTPTTTYQRSVSEDSGFGSLPTDKSQDSSLDHDGSFQELLPSYRSCESSQRRSRLQRQKRLSTLREGGSQSEEHGRKSIENDLPQGKHQSLSKEDEVFVFDNTTPCRSASIHLSDIVTPLRDASDKQDDFTPLWTSKLNTTPRNTAFHAHQDDLTPLWTPASRPNNTTPNSAPHAEDFVTPLRITALKLENLSLTPALQLVHTICQQRARRPTFQSLSMEEELRSAIALAETPVLFRTTMPLAGLIGRKMGLRQLDILTELKKRNLRHILSGILDHLSPKDVYRFGRVCKSWNEMIVQDKRASCRRRLYLEVEANEELGRADRVPDAETRLSLPMRHVLASVQAQARTPTTFCTPQATKDTLTPLQRCASDPGGGSSSWNRERFMQVAKTLFNDEHLKQCPRCQHPARCHSVKKEGVCSRADCSFHFCTDCLCGLHGSKECGGISAGRSQSKKDRLLLPGSARSKRNLRRL